MTFETERLTALRRAVAGGLLGAVALVAGPAGAQVAAPSPIIVSPQEVAACLCLERTVSQLSNEVLARHRLYEESRRQLEQLDGELAERRARLNINDNAQLDAFRSLLDRRNAAEAEFAAQVTPELAATVDIYNRHVADFNAGCVSRIYDPTVLAQVRPNLACPAR